MAEAVVVVAGEEDDNASVQLIEFVARWVFDA